jgi:alkaline phosphatase D
MIWRLALILLVLLARPALANPPLAVMVGPTEMTEATLWVQTRQPAQVQIRFYPEHHPEQTRQSAVFETHPEQALSVQIVLTDLKPAANYHWEVWLNGERQSLSFQPRLRTQPLWRSIPDPAPVRFALGSCVYLNDPESDANGYGQGGDYQIFEAIRQQQPDFMLWMGDNVYLREPDFFAPSRLERRYRQLRELPEARPLLGSLPHYAIWDDHDYAHNDSDRSYRLRDPVLAIFRHYWPGNYPVGGGIYQRFQWSDAEFFLTDNRYFRAPNGLSDPDKDFFGPAQTAWLKDALSSSTAPFKLIVIGNQVLNTRTPSENFYSYTRAFADFTGWLERARIPGVILLSGDRHHSELLKKERPGTYPLYEYTVSPLTSKAYPPFPAEQTLPERVPGSLVVQRNFGVVAISGPHKQRQLELQTRDSRGQLLWKHVIAERELQP